MVASVEQVQIMRFYKDDRALRSINFSVGTFRVEGGDRFKGYQALDMLIHHRKISVTRRFSDVGFGKGAVSYMMDGNSLTISSDFPINTPYGKAILAHEGAHALMDLRNIGPINRGISEAIGYIAEAMWLRISDYDPLKDKDGKIIPIRDKAYDIADTLVSARSSIVPERAYTALAQLIRNDSQYNDASPHISDGIA